MGVAHEPWLVALSLFVAIQGAYVGLNLALKLDAVRGVRRRPLLAGAALTLGVGIWAMHFVGMLAAKLPGPVDYLVLPTLLSFLVCVIVVALALLAASVHVPKPWSIGAAAVFMGLGIVSMHYIGMMALHASLHLDHDWLYVILSAAVAIGASALALWRCFGKGPKPSPTVAAIALGLAISGMHYTAMAGLTVRPRAGSVAALSPALSADLLAIVVAIIAFFVSGIFLLTLLPDRPDAGVEPNELAVLQPEVAAPASIAPTREAQKTPGRGPLGGAGQPSRRYADRLPVERAGATAFIHVDKVAGVQANGHYTFLFDGANDLFCPLPISDVADRLDPSKFVRVHRSHLVNLDHITSLKKVGDSTVLELAGDVRRTVPVSLARSGALKAQLGSRIGNSSV